MTAPQPSAKSEGRSGRAIVAVSVDLIRDLLHMPDTTSVIGALRSEDGFSIELLVTSPDLPADGACRILSPTVTHHPERYEWNWNAEVARD